MVLITQRSHDGDDFGTDFHAVREFLHRINRTIPMAAPEFSWARWDWNFCLPYLDRVHLDRIGIWDSGGEVVGLASHETELGEAYLAVDPRYRRELLPRLVEHALEALHDGASISIFAGDDEPDLARLLAGHGMLPVDRYEETAVIDLARTPRVVPPAGYRVTTLADGLDLDRFNRCLHRGFHQPEPIPTDPATIYWRARSTSAPSLIPELNTIVVAPDGEYASYCGMFFDPFSEYAVVEPVCTDPAHRRRGCGRAAVLTALRAAAARGARRAYVGSSQQFYYDLGFVPFHRAQWWRRRARPSSTGQDGPAT